METEVNRVFRRSNCHFCGYLCGLTTGVEAGKVISLEPDLTRYPYDESIMKSCRRWKKNLDVIDSPDRVNYPLKRVGERGSGQWERVSWDAALDDIAARLQALAQENGPQTLASAIGGPHGSYWPLHRFLNLWGTPNNMGIGQICWNPHIWTDSITFGWPLEVDLDPEVTKNVFLWGTNPAESDNSLFWRSLFEMSKTDVSFVVVDSRKTRTALRADVHLMIYPGTDNTLALAMIHVIIKEKLYDEAFVTQWCSGFDELVAHVEPYTPEIAAEICCVPAEDIQRAARIFADSPTAFLSGRGLDQLGNNTVPTHRALALLRAITGNVDRRGASLINVASDFIPEVDLEMSTSLTPEQRATSLNAQLLSLQTYEGYEKVGVHTKRLGRTLPMRYLTSVHPDLVWKAVLEGDPYPVRALIVMGCNPLLTYADSKRVCEALMALDLLVVLEYYKTPTAQLADYILPSAGALERPLFQAHGGVANIAYGGPAAVEPYYERRADYDFFRELGMRLGQEEYWPDETLADAYETTLGPTDITWQEFCDSGLYHRHPGFCKHEYLDARTGQPQGFATASGKVELASDVLEELGSERLPSGALPRERDLPQTGELSREWDLSQARNLPREHTGLVLITGARIQPFYASSYFQDESFRKIHPYPFAELSQQTADKFHLVEGDVVSIKTEKGSALFKVHIIEMVDNVISAEYGWWYPEMKEGLPNLSGMWRSNVNVLTSADATAFDRLVGTWVYNGIPCTVKKVNEELPA